MLELATLRYIILSHKRWNSITKLTLMYLQKPSYMNCAGLKGFRFFLFIVLSWVCLPLKSVFKSFHGNYSNVMWHTITQGGLYCIPLSRKSPIKDEFIQVFFCLNSSCSRKKQKKNTERQKQIITYLNKLSFSNQEQHSVIKLKFCEIL